MTIVFKVSDNVKQKMIKFYEDKINTKTPPYAVFQVKDFDCTTTLYESGKVMFQGIGADIEASVWMEEERILNNRHIQKELDKKEKKDKDKDKDKKDFRLLNMSTIGSDECGTGDYFGPIIVVATYVDKKDIMYLDELGVKDSKKITDDKIISIAPKLIKKIPYSAIILDNETYNKNYSTEINMNKIKAILHNKVLVSLLNKGPFDYEKIVVDQFVYPKKYFEHIKEVQNKVTNIYFLTHAEDQCYSVAAASIISRFIFLQEMDKISDKYKIVIPKGAGPLVDETAKIIVEKYGIEELSKIAKTNFKNTDKVKELLK